MVMPRVNSKGGDGGGGGGDAEGSAGRHTQRGLEWSLRSLRKIDTSAQHYLTNYYGGGGNDDDDDDSVIHANGENGESVQDQSAYEIFKGVPQSNAATGASKRNDHPTTYSQQGSVWAALNAPLRTGVVDGRKVIFELLSDVTQRPKTSREERLQRSRLITNSDQSSFEIRFRFWLMHFKVSTLSLVFFICFLILNVIFGMFFWLIDEKCCGDSTFNFADNFNFAIQSSTTIGYGSFSPNGHVSNFLVVMLNYASTLLTTLFAGLLFTKFVTPIIKIQFSNVMTMCNVNGVPCISVKLGNADGSLNPLKDINVRLTYSYQIPYVDHKGDKKFFRQTEDLRLLMSRQPGLKNEAWTLRHVMDESSPLFGLRFDEHPGDKIYVFTLSVDAVQDLTKSGVNVQTEYALEDILIGHRFQDIRIVDSKDERIITSDFSKLSDTEPNPVWYPAKRGAYSDNAPALKKFNV